MKNLVIYYARLKYTGFYLRGTTFKSKENSKHLSNIRLSIISEDADQAGMRNSVMGPSLRASAMSYVKQITVMEVIVV